MSSTQNIVIATRHWVRDDKPIGSSTPIQIIDPSIFKLHPDLPDVLTIGIPPTSTNNPPASSQTLDLRLQEWKELSTFAKSNNLDIRIKSSPYIRCIQTAHSLRRLFFNFKSIEIEIDNELREVGHMAFKHTNNQSVYLRNGFQIINETPLQADTRYRSYIRSEIQKKYSNPTMTILISHGNLLESMGNMVGMDTVYSIPELSYIGLTGGAFVEYNSGIQWTPFNSDGSIGRIKWSPDIQAMSYPTDYMDLFHEVPIGLPIDLPIGLPIGLPIDPPSSQCAKCLDINNIDNREAELRRREIELEERLVILRIREEQAKRILND